MKLTKLTRKQRVCLQEILDWYLRHVTKDSISEEVYKEEIKLTRQIMNKLD